MTFAQFAQSLGYQAPDWVLEAYPNSVYDPGEARIITMDELRAMFPQQVAAYLGENVPTKDDIYLANLNAGQLKVFNSLSPDQQRAILDMPNVDLYNWHVADVQGMTGDQAFNYLQQQNALYPELLRQAQERYDAASSWESAVLPALAALAIPGGLAALGAGGALSGLGVEAAPAAEAGLSATGLGSVSPEAAAAFSAAPEIAAPLAEIVPATLPESYWTMQAAAPSAVTDVAPAVIESAPLPATTGPYGGYPMPPPSPAIANAPAVTTSGGYITGSAAGDAALKGALVGGATSGIAGGDPVQGALTGGVMGGAGNLIGANMPGLTGNALADQALTSAGVNAVKAGVSGGDPAQAALGGALNTGVNAIGNAAWGALSNQDAAPQQTEPEQTTSDGALNATVQQSGDTNMAEWFNTDYLPLVDQAAGGYTLPDFSNTSQWNLSGDTTGAIPAWGDLSSPVNLADSRFNVDGSINWSNPDAVGLAQMGQAAGLTGQKLVDFVRSGGTQGSTAAGGGGVGTGQDLAYALGGGSQNFIDLKPQGGVGGTGGTASSGGTWNINLNNTLTAPPDANRDQNLLGSLPSWALPALVAGLTYLDNPDRTSTQEVKYPDWYNTGAKSALGQADKYAALGPDSVAPLSANENAAIDMARDSSGVWVPQLNKAAGTLDESKTAFDRAGALTSAVPAYLNAGIGQVDAAMPLFNQGALTAGTVGGYLNRAGGQVDAAMPYFGKAGGQVDAAMPYFGKAGSTADSVSGYLNKSGALADEAAGGIPSLNLSAYMNPYLDNVLAPIARRNELQKQQALNELKAQAGMKGAFGGSRSTLLESQTAEAADRNLNEAEAGIRANAFQTALSTAQADLARKLGASQQYGALAGTAGNTANIYGGLGKGIADTGNIYTGVGKSVADTAGTFTTAGNVAGNTAGIYGGLGKGVADTADVFNKAGTTLAGTAGIDTGIGKALTDTASGYRSNAGVLGTLTDADIARLTGTGGLQRGVAQSRLNAPLNAIGGYAAALRGAGTPGSTTTSMAPEASKIGQVATGLGALYGAKKAGYLE